MHGFLVEKHGPPEILRWTQLPDPRPGPGQVLIAVSAVGINHLDIWVRKGVPGHRFPLPMVPGSDIVGTVAEVGEGVGPLDREQRFFVSPGYSCGRCRFCLSGEHNLCREYGIFGESCDGGYAQFVAVPAVNLVPVPDGLSDTQAASIPLTFLTAWHMLVTRAGVRPGMHVLVHAASSGVSSAAIQIARLFGATVYATASSDEKLAYARELGAQHTINYEEVSFAREIRGLTGKAGVDIVVDHVGQSTWKGNLACVRKGGTVVFCGATSGAEVEMDLRPVFFKSLSILGSTMGSLGEMLEIARLFQQGQLRPNLHQAMPIRQAPEAHRLIEERKVLGKLVLHW